MPRSRANRLDQGRIQAQHSSSAALFAPSGYDVGLEKLERRAFAMLAAPCRTGSTHGAPAAAPATRTSARIAGVEQQQQAVRPSCCACRTRCRACASCRPASPPASSPPPRGCSQLTSLTPVREAVPFRNVSRRNSAWPRRSLRQQAHELDQVRDWPRRAASRPTISRCPGSRRCCCPAACAPNSSPACSIGTPCDRNSVASILRIWRGAARRPRRRRWAPRRRNSSSGCCRCRRRCSRGWPRCAGRCRTPDRAA